MALALGGYETLARQMVDLYGEAELVMLGRVSKRLARGVTAPGWTERKYAETAAARRDLSSLVDRLSKQRRTLSNEALNTAYSKAEEDFLADLMRSARDFGDTVSSFHGMRVAEILADLNRRMDAADRSILRCANDAYADAIAHVSALTATGTITAREAVKRACADLADKGILSFTDERGRRWQMDTYAEMATLTALHRAAIAGYTDRMTEFGYDLAIISSHEGACPICAAWQGVVVSVSGGTRGYPSLSEAEAAGVFHPRCMHHISIWREGITPGGAGPSGEGRRSPREIEEPSVPYTERSRQRYMERTIRRWKRRQAAATDAIGEREARAYVTKWQRALREHIAEAEATLLRQYYREGGKTPLSEAAKALPALHITPSGRILQQVKEWKSHKTPDPDGQTPYAAFVKDASAGTRTLYLYDRDGRVIMHIDNAGHATPGDHTFIDENGQETQAHYHVAIWDENGEFKGYGGVKAAKAVTNAMRKDFPDLLKGR